MLETVIVVLHLLGAIGIVVLVLLQQGKVRTLARRSVRVLRQPYSEAKVLLPF